MNSLFKGIISLIKSGIDGTKINLPSDFCWEKTIEILKEHKLVMLAYYGVYNSGIELPENINSFFKQFVFQAAIYEEKQNHEIENILKAFSKNKIDHLPLKGCVLKKVYPKSEMRPMSDADILITKEQKALADKVMAELGFRLDEETHHEIIYIKDNVFIELHKSLIPDYNKDYYSYYGDGWKFANRKDEYSYEFSPEDMFIFLLTHFAKHYRDGGISILHMVDLWVYMREYSLDENYMKEELEKLNLYKFYSNICETVNCWFIEGKSTEMSDFFAEKMFNNKRWGSEESRFISDTIKYSNESSSKNIKLKRIINVIFPSVEYMKFRYPVLQKHKWCLPLTWISRWFETIFKKRKNIKEISINLKNTDFEEVKRYKNELEYVGLEYKFY